MIPQVLDLLTEIFVLCARKKLAKIEKKANLNFLAGQLCSPEESCRIVSRVLSRMSSVPHMSPTWKKFNDILISQIAHETDQDRWFLDGTAVEVRIKLGSIVKDIFGFSLTSTLFALDWSRSSYT